MSLPFPGIEMSQRDLRPRGVDVTTRFCLERLLDTLSTRGEAAHPALIEDIGIFIQRPRCHTLGARYQLGRGQDAVCDARGGVFSRVWKLMGLRGALCVFRSPLETPRFPPARAASTTDGMFLVSVNLGDV